MSIPNPKSQAALRALDLDPNYVHADSVDRSGYGLLPKDWSNVGDRPIAFHSWISNEKARFNPKLVDQLLAAMAEEFGQLEARNSSFALEAALYEAQSRVTAINKANGWFEDDRTVGDDIALLHSEVSEMLEAFRVGGLEDQTSKYGSVEVGTGRNLPAKPEGFGSEAADVLIRLLDTCQRRGVDLAYEFERKLEFNATRGHKHGGKNL